MLESILKEFRVFARRYRRAPFSSTWFVLIVGLTIALSSAVFTVRESLLLRSLPYRSPDQLVLIDRLPIFDFSDSPAAYEEWKQASTLLSGASLYAVSQVDLFGDLEPRSVAAAEVSPGLFRLLGVQPVLGRGFLAEESIPGSDRVAVISSRLWRQQFGARPGIVGTTMHLNGLSFQITGVVETSKGFPAGIDVWTPTVHDGAVLERFSATGRYVLARLRRFATVAQADRQQREWLRGSRFATEAERSQNPSALPPMVWTLRTDMTGPFQPALKLIMLAAAMVVALGCTTAAFIVLIRVDAARHEIAMRHALGANAWQVFRILAAEHAELALGGGVCGVLLCRFCIGLVKALLPLDWPSQTTVQVNAPVVLFAIGTTALFTVLACVYPYMRSAVLRTQGANLLMSIGRHTRTSNQKRTSRVITAAEAALATMLLVGASSAIRVAVGLYNTPLGFDVDSAIAVSVSQVPQNNSQSEVEASLSNAIEALRTVPGVADVSGIDLLPLRSKTAPFEELKAARGRTASASPHIVAPAYFRCMGIRQVKGRDLEPTDDARHPKVVVVDSGLAKELWPHESAIGQTVRDGRESYRVVGVVSAVRFFGPAFGRVNAFYRPLMQASPRSFSYIVVPRIGGAPIYSLRRVIQQKARGQVIEDINYIREYRRQLIQVPLSLATVMSIIGAAAGIMAFSGIVGIILDSVLRARRDIAIRLALGATALNLASAAVRESAQAVLAGVVAGIAGIFAAYQLQFTTQVKNALQLDPRTALLVGCSFILCASVASCVAASGIIRIDPARTLKSTSE